MTEAIKLRALYWDACVFLSLINEHPDRAHTIETILHETRLDSNSIIYTSSDSIVEVAHAAQEKMDHRLSNEILDKIDSMFGDESVVRIVDNGSHIAYIARDIVRDAIPQGWSLKPKDATHLATAQWINKRVQPLAYFHTYDDRLEKFQAMIGIHVCEPEEQAPTMDF